METTDLASVLGIVSGVSASLGLICFAVALTARFRHAHHRQKAHQQQQLLQRNNVQPAGGNTTATDGPTTAEIKNAQVDLITNNSGTTFYFFFFHYKCYNCYFC